MTKPSDPLYQDQWHFDLIGDIETIWDDYDGTGVSVGIYDDGVDYDHPDLDDNYDASLHVKDDGGQVLDPFPVAYLPGGFGTSDLHGTAVAGIIAGEANGVGGVGVSSGASITGVNIFGAGVYGNVNTDLEGFLAMVEQAGRFDISQNSWGSTPRQSAESSLANPTGFAARLDEAYAGIAEDGRGGLGTVITQAAGNDGMDANRDGVNASRYTITIAATEATGIAASYSNFGACILVTAPAASVTTDLSGLAGDTAGDYLTNFGGTSAATPVVSGVVALMLEANTALGWRDVQNILAASATHTGSAFGSITFPEDGQWYVNDADTWNGGGMHVSSNYGYGMVNVYNAVRMAEVWSLFSATAATSANERSVSSSIRTADLAVPDGNATGASFTLTVGQGITIEHVALTLDLSSSRVGDLRVVLTSPEGTDVVVVLEDRLRTAVNGEWVYGIDSLRGELSAGTWTVQVIDTLANGSTSVVKGASLEVYGSDASANDVHHITDEFLMMKALDSSRGKVDDTDGGTDWLSFVTVTANVVLSLVAGQAFSVGGVVWGSIASGSSFENAVTGDGSDKITGNSLANLLDGMRGNDTLSGGDGNDTLDGDYGSDTLEGGTGNDTLAGSDGNDRETGGSGNDSQTGGAGNDTMNGNDGNDFLKAGTGNDTVAGDAGADTLYGFDGNDRLDGGADNDRVYGEIGNDSLYGGAGNDTMSGADGADRLEGSDGGDRLTGEAGNDSLYGGSGADVLDGAVGADSLVGGEGNDTLSGGDDADRLEGGAQDDSLQGGAGNDTLFGADGTDRLEGGDGNDQLKGETGNDSLYGNAGADRLEGNNGNDSLYGSDGNDTLLGGNGIDRLEANKNDDRLEGGEGNDTLLGGDGNDVLIGGTGNDRLDSGNGTDVFIFTSKADSGTGSGTRDVIAFFDRGSDRIDLSALDADSTLGGNQAFSFIGTKGFSDAGQLRYYAAEGGMVAEVDIDGNGKADMQIFIQDVTGLGAGDFLL